MPHLFTRQDYDRFLSTHAAEIKEYPIPVIDQIHGALYKTFRCQPSPVPCHEVARSIFALAGFSAWQLEAKFGSVIASTLIYFASDPNLQSIEIGVSLDMDTLRQRAEEEQSREDHD